MRTYKAPVKTYPCPKCTASGRVKGTDDLLWACPCCGGSGQARMGQIKAAGFNFKELTAKLRAEEKAKDKEYRAGSRGVPDS